MFYKKSHTKTPRLTTGRFRFYRIDDTDQS